VPRSILRDAAARPLTHPRLLRTSQGGLVYEKLSPKHVSGSE